MSFLLNIYESFSNYVVAKNKVDWANANPSMWDICAMIEKERYKQDLQNGG